MTLIEDVGGFNGGIMLIPALIMSTYSKSMFESSLEQEIPIRRANGRKSNRPNQGPQQEDDIASIGKQM